VHGSHVKFRAGPGEIVTVLVSPEGDASPNAAVIPAPES